MPKNFHPNNERLRELIKKHRLRRRDVASLLGKKTSVAVNKWLAPKSDPLNFRAMPDIELELLELKLGERKLELWDGSKPTSGLLLGRRTDR